MGFWHTGYEEFHESPYQPRVINYVPPPLLCPDCSDKFNTERELEKHRFTGHPTAHPVLLFASQEVGSTRLQIHQDTPAEYWSAINCETISINGVPVAPGGIGIVLASAGRGIHIVEMTNGKSRRSVEIDFAVPSSGDLDGVDHCLATLAESGQLKLSRISKFVDDAEIFATARLYRDGIANYLYGVLARERSPESRLLHSQYVDKFNVSAEMLNGFDRPAAEAICALISFHYNHFEEARSKSPGTQSASASHRLELLFDGEIVPPSHKVQARPDHFERMLVDSVTARVLELCSVPLDGSAGSEISDLERELDSHEPFDQLKLRIIAVEHHSRSGDENLTREHELAVGYNNGANGWVKRRINQREGRAKQ